MFYRGEGGNYPITSPIFGRLCSFTLIKCYSKLANNALPPPPPPLPYSLPSLMNELNSKWGAYQQAKLATEKLSFLKQLSIKLNRKRCALKVHKLTPTYMTRIKIKNHWIKQTDKHTHTYTQRNKDDNLNKMKANKKRWADKRTLKNIL